MGFYLFCGVYTTLSDRKRKGGTSKHSSPPAMSDRCLGEDMDGNQVEGPTLAPPPAFPNPLSHLGRCIGNSETCGSQLACHSSLALHPHLTEEGVGNPELPSSQHSRQASVFHLLCLVADRVSPLEADRSRPFHEKRTWEKRTFQTYDLAPSRESGPGKLWSHENILHIAALNKLIRD